MQREILQQLIGSGSGWPIMITEAKGVNGDTEYTQNKDGTPVPKLGWYPVNGGIGLIKQNLSTLIDTQIGAMMRNETFGTRICEVLEEPNNQTAAFLIKKYISDPVGIYEPRITLTNVQSITEGGRLRMLLRYKLRNTEITDILTTEYSL